MTLHEAVTSIDPEAEELDDEELEVIVTEEEDEEVEEVMVLELDVLVEVEIAMFCTAHIELEFFGA